MKRASYKHAIRWIAGNDNDGEHHGPSELRNYISVLLVADLFELSPARVAVDVWTLREKWITEAPSKAMGDEP